MTDFLKAAEFVAKAVRSGVVALTAPAVHRAYLAHSALNAFEEEHEALEGYSAQQAHEAALRIRGGRLESDGPDAAQAAPHVPRCTNCDTRLGEIAAKSQIVSGMFCSNRCVSVAEVREAIADIRKTPAASAAAVEAPQVGEPPLPPEGAASWVEYVTPAIMDVLSEHRPYAYHEDGYLWCLNSSGHNHATHGDWNHYDWREHVAPILAERLERVTLSIPKPQQ